MQHSKYVIIGGGLAGGSACEGIRKLDAQGSITLVTREGHLPYQRPPLSKGYLQGRQGLGKVYLHPQDYYDQNHITLRMGAEVVRLDPSAHLVELAGGDALQYDKLLLAVGGQARRLAIPGAELAGILTLRTIEDADAIRAAAVPGARALVLGGSFIGCETAASLSLLGAQVTMVFPEARLLERAVVPELSAYLAAKFAAHGVEILPGVTPLRFEGRERVERVLLSNGRSLAVGLVVMGVGIRLDTDMARAAGLALDPQGAVLVDQFLAASAPDIYAAGDIASWPSALYDKRLRVEHWDVAYNQGLRAGRNMAGENKPYRTLPLFFSDIYDFSFDVCGDLTSWEQTLLRGSLDSGSFAYFYFRAGTLTAALTANRPKEEGQAAAALIRARMGYELLAGRLVDEAFDLSTLVQG